MAHWLVKTEPETYSIDDLRKEKRTLWDGVRNYQARNFLRSMEPGDLVLVYHSVTEPVGIAGLARVRKKAVPDPTQFDRRSKYHDDKATLDNPRWFAPELEFIEKFERVLELSEIKTMRGLEKMELLKRGSRLSVQPVTKKQYDILTRG